MQKLIWAIVLLCAFHSSSIAQKQDGRPIRLVVTFAPGGGTDAVARRLNIALGESLKQTVIVENRLGAGGSIATNYVAKSPPDGKTILFTTSSHSINQAIYPKLPFDTEHDLRGVTYIGSVPQVLAVNPKLPANNLKEYLALCKTAQVNCLYASGGVGVPGHLAGEVLAARTDIALVNVPYRGAGPAIADVIGNQVPAVIGTLSGLLPHLQAGRLKAIAITSAKRSPLLPSVETVAETFPGYEEDTWFGTFVPRGTSDEIVNNLHAATLAAMADPAVKESLDNQALQVVGAGPKRLDEIVHAEIREISKIVKNRNIRPE